MEAPVNGGRKRIPNRDKVTAEDEALTQIAQEAEAQLAAKRAARAEAREIRMKELERQQKEEDSEKHSRPSRRHASMSDDDERMSVGSRGSLRPSDYGGFLGSGSRTSSRASSARASPVVEERPDRDFLDKGSRTVSTLSAATLASLGGVSSRRGSGDTSFSMETEASIREIKDSLAESEEKYRKAMVSNAQLHNHKSTLMYQVDNMKEALTDMEEQLWEARRQYHDKSKECEHLCHSLAVLQFQLDEVRQMLSQSEELLTEVTQLRLKSSSCSRMVADLQETLEWKEKKIAALERQTEISDIVRLERNQLRDEVVRLVDLLKKHGIFVSPEVTTNGDAGQDEDQGDVDTDSASHLVQEPSQDVRENMLVLRLRKVIDERETLQDEVRLLRSRLDQKLNMRTDGIQNPLEDSLENGVDSHLVDLQRDANRQISDLKFKLVKSEQEVAVLEQNIIRLEGQVVRYKSSSENAERVEDELKVEKRKMQRELRSALDRVDELEAANSHLTKRLEKMKANRSALLAQQ